MTTDGQLRGVSLEAVIEKRRLDQALNAKEFAVLAGISYSTSRAWFRSPGFPVVRGMVFWTDFVEWRRRPNGKELDGDAGQQIIQRKPAPTTVPSLPSRAARLLAEA